MFNYQRNNIDKAIKSKGMDQLKSDPHKYAQPSKSNPHKVTKLSENRIKVKDKVRVGYKEIMNAIKKLS